MAKKYREHGYESLLKHNQGGKRREAIDAKTHKAIEKRLLSPTNGFTSYKQLQEWVDEHYIKDIKYITLLKYVQTKFGAKLKVARKSHIKKDIEALEAFKKILNFLKNILRKTRYIHRQIFIFKMRAALVCSHV